VKALRSIGQFFGLIYRDDGSWQIGPQHRHEPPASNGQGGRPGGPRARVREIGPARPGSPRGGDSSGGVSHPGRAAGAVRIPKKTQQEADRRAGESLISLLDQAGKAEVETLLARGEFVS
jgi:hypothetical protein